MGEILGRSEVIESTSDNTETTWDDLRKIPFVQETKNSYFYTGVNSLRSHLSQSTWYLTL